MLCSEPQGIQRERVDFAVVIGDVPGRLKTLERIDGIVPPDAIDVAFEETAIGEGLLDLLVTLGVGMELKAGPGSDMPPRAAPVGTGAAGGVPGGPGL